MSRQRCILCSSYDKEAAGRHCMFFDESCVALLASTIDSSKYKPLSVCLCIQVGPKKQATAKNCLHRIKPHLIFFRQIEMSTEHLIIYHLLNTVRVTNCMTQIPLGSTRLDTFDFVEPVEPVEQVETSVSSETSRALPTWRTTNDLVQV